MSKYLGNKPPVSTLYNDKDGNPPNENATALWQNRNYDQIIMQWAHFRHCLIETADELEYYYKNQIQPSPIQTASIIRKIRISADVYNYDK